MKKLKHLFRKRRSPRQGSFPSSGKLLFGSLLMVVLIPGRGAGQEGRTEVEEGNRLYSEGRFGEAHAKYLEALLENPESALIQFNDGSALYQSKEFQRAMERFLEAAGGEDPSLQGAAWYNLGNALYREQRLEESLEAYKEALRRAPSDADAKHNLERVLEKLREQEEQENQESGGEEQQEEGEREESQPDQDQGEEGQPDQQGNPEGEEPQDQEPQEGGESPEQAPEEGEESPPEPQEGEMTPEEAQRLLNAIREDPGEVNRRRAPATGKRPKKDW